MAPLSSTNPSQTPADPILYSFKSPDDLSKGLADFVIKVSRAPGRRLSPEGARKKVENGWDPVMESCQ